MARSIRIVVVLGDFWAQQSRDSQECLRSDLCSTMQGQDVPRILMVRSSVPIDRRDIFMRLLRYTMHSLSRANRRSASTSRSASFRWSISRRREKPGELFRATINTQSPYLGPVQTASSTRRLISLTELRVQPVHKRDSGDIPSAGTSATAKAPSQQFGRRSKYSNTVLLVAVQRSHLISSPFQSDIQ